MSGSDVGGNSVEFVPSTGLMKRCPQCNRVEPNDALAFCRADGTPLISGDRSETKFGSGAVPSEIETSILPPTVPDVARPTAATSVLSRERLSDRTDELKSRRRKLLLLAIAAVISVALGILIYLRLGTKDGTPINSVAVLPFQNSANDPNTEYLSDGISEALINSLTELQQLRVIARSTAFRYKGKDVDPQQVAKDLNVQTVLMGRVRQVGDTLNVQVDLIDATTGTQLWGRDYERKATDVLEVKQTIAREVTDQLRLKISVEEKQRLVRGDTRSAEAYRFYLRGRYFWNQRGGDRLTKALAEFQKAIDRDPNYALGYVGIADCYIVQEENAGVRASESLPKARAAVDRALALDDSSAEAHTSSAMIYQHQWRWAEAENEYKKAISLNANYPTAHQWYSNYLFASGQLDQSLREGKRAQELDPLAPIISHNVAFVYLLKNDLDSAIAESTRALEVSPNFPALLNDLGWAYFKQQHYEKAAVQFQKAVDSSGRASSSLGNLGYCYAVSGRRDESLSILKELEQRYAEGKAVGVFLAGVYSGLGDNDKAFALLEKDYEQHSGQIPTITFWMSLERLRTDPRYTDLVRRIWLKPSGNRSSRPELEPKLAAQSISFSYRNGQ